MFLICPCHIETFIYIFWLFLLAQAILFLKEFYYLFTLVKFNYFILIQGIFGF